MMSQAARLGAERPDTSDRAAEEGFAAVPDTYVGMAAVLLTARLR